MKVGKIAVILAVDDVPWPEVEQMGSKVKWITVSQEALNEVLKMLAIDEVADMIEEKERASDQGIRGDGGPGGRRRR